MDSMLQRLNMWFKGYVRTFYSDDSDLQSRVLLKEQHTARVCSIINQLGCSLGLTKQELAIAGVVALFHDVGRFLQYKKYRTFNDAKSVDHAILAIDILEEDDILYECHNDKEIICQAIFYHNKRDIPEFNSARQRLFAQMIRDADKLDIFAIIVGDTGFKLPVSSEYQQKKGYSPQVISDILAMRMPEFGEIRTAADQMLFRLSWIYNINFPFSFRYISEKRYMQRMFDTLPQTNEIYEVKKHLLNYLKAGL